MCQCFPDANSFHAKYSTHPFKWHEQIELFAVVVKLKSQDFSCHFRQPVDPILLDIPSYHEITKCPMDLSKIETKLNLDQYLTADAIAKDVCLMVSNCRTFNGDGSSILDEAYEVEDCFERLVKKLMMVTTDGRKEGLDVVYGTCPEPADEDEDDDETDEERDVELDVAELDTDAEEDGGVHEDTLTGDEAEDKVDKAKWDEEQIAEGRDDVALEIDKVLAENP